MMRMRRISLLLSTLAILVGSHRNLYAVKYPFRTYTAKDGLASNQVGSILQDRKGCLWLSTQGGISRFNGLNFTNYSVTDGLAGNSALKIFEDSRGGLWASFWGGGVSRYDGEKWTTLSDDYLRDNTVWTFFEDSRGRLWVTTFGAGVACLDKAGWQYHTVADGLPDNRVRTVFEDSKGNLWFGFQQYGVCRFDGKNWKHFYPLGPGALCQINSIVEDKEGDIWLAGYSKIKRESVAIEIRGTVEQGNYRIFDHKDGIPLGSDPSLLQDSQGNIWYSAQGGGVGVYDGTGWKTYTTQNGLPSDNITSIFEDKEKNLWFGTWGDGLVRLSDRAFVTYTEADGLPGNSVAPALEDRQGNLWFNDRYVEGVARYDGNKWTTYTSRDGLCSDHIVHLYMDSKGVIWFSSGYEISTLDGSRWKNYILENQWINRSFFEDRNGVIYIGTFQYKFNGRTIEPCLLKGENPDSPPSVLSTAQDTAGNLLFGTTECLLVFNGTDLRKLERGRVINAITGDPERCLWFATDSGLVKSDIQDYYGYAGENERLAGIRYTIESGLAHNDVLALCRDASGAVWAGTNGGGVSRLKDDAITNFTVENGLSSNVCNYILESGSRLYFVMSNGLNCYDGETFKVYTEEDGFTANTQSQPLLDRKGNLWFRSPNGVIKYDPSSDRPTLIQPPVYITGLKLFDKSIPVRDGIVLDYDMNGLNIEFVGICFASPGVLYNYRLEGLEADWIPTRQNSVSYTNLPEGRYTFKVKARNQDGVWSRETATLSFRILPPFWATLWFRVLSLVAIVAAFYGIHEFRTRFIKKRNLELLHEVSERKKVESALRKEHAEVESLKNRLQAENIYLQEEIRIEHDFKEIISNSDALNKVLERVEQVAATDATVLILGETGTGKQLIARAVHNVSPRAERALVTVNCAALPATLIESELFGHEKGAFTGALSRKIGRFELADGGSIFLDEIGEMPLDLQAKLLRVLQDGEFERLGSTATIRVNVRIIAATNRDLEKEVRQDRFRQDLFYRLNVYPITCPPLREHKEDIPLLVNHFVNKYSAQAGKKINFISPNLIDNLQSYDWPGNVRELENVIERAVIVSRRNKLELAESLQKETQPRDRDSRTPTLEELEREHIVKVLKTTGWRIRGKSGAAEILGLKPTTLESRMDKLGIRRNT
ncbi:sigma 54-interacting transcriptional regulator [bacterium]|nr:sigma 54-interacting transcriptional regulator [bacterium]